MLKELQRTRNFNLNDKSIRNTKNDKELEFEKQRLWNHDKVKNREGLFEQKESWEMPPKKRSGTLIGTTNELETLQRTTGTSNWTTRI